MENMMPALVGLIVLALNFVPYSVDAIIRPYKSNNIHNSEGELSYHSWKDIPEWDYLLFVQRWPPSVCAGEDGQAVQQHIHKDHPYKWKRSLRQAAKCAFPPVMSRNVSMCCGR